MAQLRSIFGEIAEDMQYLVDRRIDQFTPSVFENYLDWGIPQTNLTFETIIGASRVNAIASVVSRDSLSPLRSRDGARALTGRIPAIKEKFKLTETETRTILDLARRAAGNAAKLQMLDLLFNDVKAVGNAAMGRLDYMTLEGVSTGQVTITIENNPDGIITPVPLPMGIPAESIVNSVVSWDAADATTTKPITDIGNFVTAQGARGVTFDRMEMTKALFLKLIKSKEVIDYITAAAGVTKGTVMPNLRSVNAFLEDQLLPQIRLVDVWKGVEKDGKVNNQEPFKNTNVAFLPAGKIGIVHNATAIEQTSPVNTVNYAIYNRALISKWRENEPFAEYTKVELNAFPGFDAADSMGILVAVHP